MDGDAGDPNPARRALHRPLDRARVDRPAELVGED
jgi:hypothetical protein